MNPSTILYPSSTVQPFDGPFDKLRMQLRTQPRPAGMGYICDHWYQNLDYQPNSDLPLLLRCHEQAAIRLTILAPDDCYQVKRCPACADRLRQEAARGATFEILAELEIK